MCRVTACLEIGAGIGEDADHGEGAFGGGKVDWRTRQVGRIDVGAQPDQVPGFDDIIGVVKGLRSRAEFNEDLDEGGAIAAARILERADAFDIGGV